jgi:hypothetical protein
MLLDILRQMSDARRNQAKQYELGHIIFLSILAILSGCNSYREIENFFEVHFAKLKAHFKLKWKKRPAYTTVRNIIQGTNKDELEQSFRDYTQKIKNTSNSLDTRIIAIDGKVLRHSFDNFKDKKALHILNAFSTEGKLVLAHYEISQKSNEIPAATELIKELGLTDRIFTLDALHCQKKTLAEIKKTAMMQ